MPWARRMRGQRECALLGEGGGELGPSSWALQWTSFLANLARRAGEIISTCEFLALRLVQYRVYVVSLDPYRACCVLWTRGALRRIARRCSAFVLLL